jgi:hypothetical protein
VANPYGSYVSASQPAYQDVAASHQDVPTYGGGYLSGQRADGSWYGSAASGYLPTPGYAAGDHAGNGNGGNGYDARDQHHAPPAGNGYGAVDYQNLTYQGVDYQPAPAVPGSYAPQNQQAGQYDQLGYGVPDLAYGQDGYQGYPGYGAGGR